jgi:hypothetical protein
VGEALVDEDPQLVLDARVPERRPQEEAIELRLGQRERPLVLDRVLGREDEERVWQLSRHAVHRHLSLGHRFEQRRLRLRRRPVDLVHEHDVGEDRAGSELEVPGLLVVDGEARDVRGLEVRGALDSLRLRSLDAPRDGPRENGLRRARDVLEQDVSVTRERGQDDLDLVALSVDDGLDVVDDAVGGRGGALEALGIGFLRGDRFHARDGSCGRVGNRGGHGSATSTRAAPGC